MIDISVSGLVKEFEVGKRILDGLSFQVFTGERVGLLGPNGCGKTTLLRILTGELHEDEGEVVLAPGKRLGLISQIPVFPAHYLVEDVLEEAFRPLRELEEEMAALAGEMARGSDPALLARYDALSAAFQNGGGYETQTKKNKVCSGLSISPEMRRQPFAQLSGGEKTRVNLGRLILEDTDILLLDEPTNHLDLHATEWLEAYLKHFSGTVLTVSHDRYFLDQVVGRVVEIQEGKAEFYPGNYSFYAQEKQRRYEERLRQYEKEKAEIDRLTETARKMHEHNTEHLHKRAFSIEKRIEKLRTVDRPPRRRQMKARFGEREFRADEMLALRGIGKRFGERQLFHDLDLEVRGGERVALLGDNGAGKSTLLKILLGEETPDGGRVRLGPTVKMGYLPQQIHFPHPERSLVDTMIYELNCSAQSARDRLGTFQFRGEDVFKPVSALSGGEQSRLRLCMLMDEKINLLVLDEPTNHLDIQSREWIEEAVEDYEGSLIFVSHDRYFIDRFAQRVWLLEGGELRDYRGDYQRFLALREKEKTLAAPAPLQAEKKEKPRQTGGTKGLEKEVHAAERLVARTEEALAQLSREMEEASADYVRLQELCQRQEELEQQLLEQYEHWEALSTRLEEARG